MASWGDSVLVQPRLPKRLASFVRSEDVSPPQIPSCWKVAMEKTRHSATTPQSPHMALAGAVCWGSSVIGKNLAPSIPRHLASSLQVSGVDDRALVSKGEASCIQGDTRPAPLPNIFVSLDR